MSLVIHAPNVHRGGGKALLLCLMEACGHRDSACLALVDNRLELPKLPRHVEVIRFSPTVAGRIAAERFLHVKTLPEDVVLCLGNLPPLFRLRAHRAILFLQNRYLLGTMSTTAFPMGVRLRTAIERHWLRHRANNVQQVVVQSPSMAEAVRHCMGIDPMIAPFVADEYVSTPATDTRDNLDFKKAVFLYVASGEPHKNHRRLVEAWALLAMSGIKPLLQLTLSPWHHPDLAAWIAERGRQCGLRLENAGEVEPERLARMYEKATALVYPSLAESLGLPLLEARMHGLPIIASERDFVRDIVTPQQSFDPDSALSIARAVRRFLAIAEPELKIRTPGEFLDMVIGR